MADNDAGSTTSGGSGSNSNHSSRRAALLGIRQLSDDTKHFFRDNYHKARNLRHRQSGDSPETPVVNTPSSPIDYSGPSSPTPYPSTPSKSSLSFPFSREHRSSIQPTPAAAATSSRSSKSLPRVPVPQQPTPSLSSAAPRLHHISSLRVGLTSLVIYHHTALPYGGLGSWAWKSAYTPTTSPILAAFNAYNQTFFMAGFFWVAGYFTYSQLRKIKSNESRSHRNGHDSKRASITITTFSFILARAKRLALPAIAYTLLLRPLGPLMIALHGNDWHLLSQAQITRILKTYFSSLRGVHGPVWFCALLFIFDTLTAGLAAAKPSIFTDYYSSPKPESWQANLLKYGGLAASTIASYAIRTVFPAGAVWKPLNLLPAYLPQYVFAYTVGQISAATGDVIAQNISLLPGPAHWEPLRAFGVAVGMMTLGLGAVAGSVVAQQGGLASFSIPGAVKLLEGHGTIQSALYALWNELGFVMIFPALVAICQRYFNTRSSTTIRLPWWVWPFGRRSSASQNGKGKGREAENRKEVIEIDLSKYAYATFLVHTVVSLGVELVVERFVLPRLFKLPTGVRLGVAAGKAASSKSGSSASGGSGGWLSQALPSSGSSSGKASSSGRTAATRGSAVETVSGVSVPWWLPSLLTLAVGTVNVVASWGVGIGLLEGLPVLKRWI